MGQRGPAPEPARLRILKGETRPSQLKDAPGPQEPPHKPRGMTPAASKVWDRVLAATSYTQHIGEPHADTLRTFCEVTATLQKRNDPSSKEWRDLANTQRQLARELCLTPATGANLVPQAQEEDKLAKYLA